MTHRRWQTLALGVLVLGCLMAGTSYIKGNPAWSKELPIGNWRFAPVACIGVLALGVSFALRREARSLRKSSLFAGPARGASAFFVLWLGSVCCSAAREQQSPPFFWGALAPYLVALTAATCAVGLRVELRTTVRIAIVSAALMVSTILLDGLGMWPPQPRAPSGLLGNRNFAGEYLALVLPLCLVGCVHARSRWLLPLLGVALVWTRCRTAWLAGLAGMTVLVLATSSARRWALAGAASLVVLGALVGTVVPNGLKWAESHPYWSTAQRVLELGSGSGDLRRKQYSATFALLRDCWLGGVGPGRWQPEMRRRAPDLATNRNPHSDYLRALADGGVVGLVGLAGLYMVAGGAAWRRRRAMPEGLAFVVTIALISAADAPLYRLESTCLVFVVLAVVVTGAATAAAPPAVNVSPGGRDRLPR